MHPLSPHSTGRARGHSHKTQAAVRGLGLASKTLLAWWHAQRPITAVQSIRPLPDLPWTRHEADLSALFSFPQVGFLPRMVSVNNVCAPTSNARHFQPGGSSPKMPLDHSNLIKDYDCPS